MFHDTFGRLDVVGAEHPTKVVPQLQVGRRAGRERAGGRPATAVLVQGADDVGAAAKVGRQGSVEHLNEEYIINKELLLSIRS